MGKRLLICSTLLNTENKNATLFDSDSLLRIHYYQEAATSIKQTSLSDLTLLVSS